MQDLEVLVVLQKLMEHCAKLAVQVPVQCLQLVHPAVCVQVAPHEVFEFCGCLGVSPGAADKAEEPVQAVLVPGCLPPAFWQMGVPDLV